ncbi:MAG: phosphoribosyl-AMP cyclohydrolase [Rhodothermales bacterium]
MSERELIDRVKFDGQGLVTAVAQDFETGDILMLAYMNEQTLRQTLETGVMTYWSRSRAKVWVKGESSGNTQEVREIRIDCDGDAILFKVKQNGRAACHTGRRTCFYRRFENGELIEEGEPIFDPGSVYQSPKS